MGHIVEYKDYSEDMVKNHLKHVLEEIDSYAEEEGSNDAPSYKMRFLKNEPFKSRDDAEAYLEKLSEDKFYPQFAVRYYEQPKETKAILDLQVRIRDMHSKLYKQKSALHCKGFKSQYIGCKKCGSKLAVAYMQTNFCPLCREDIRPQSTLDSFKKTEQQIVELEKKLKLLQYAQIEKMRNRGKFVGVRWLIRFEFHV